MVEVTVVNGQKTQVPVTVSRRLEALWHVEYSPHTEGIHAVNVSFAGKEVPGSPFHVHVGPGNTLASL